MIVTPDLVVVQPVRAKAHPKTPHSTWKPGVVMAKVAPRSYLVEVDDRTYHRNRIHLRDTREVQHRPKSVVLDEPEITNTPPSTQNNNSAPIAPSRGSGTEASHTVTRSGRVSKPPSKFKDYEC